MTTLTTPQIGILSFDDVRIDAIQDGSVPMTAAERAFLVEDTPRFEECSHSAAELAAMSDADLMGRAYATWAEYASGQV